MYFQSNWDQPWWDALCELWLWINHPMFADDICVFSPSISGLQCFLNICGDYAAEHEIAFNCNKTIGVIFCPKKYEQPAPSNVFLNGVRVQVFWPSEISWCVDKCITEGWWWHSKTSEITILCSKQTQRHFWSVLSCSKKILFRAYCMPMYACQLWSKHPQTSMNYLCAAYNNAYRIMHYIPRNVSVRPHHVSHCVRTFDATLRNNLYRFFTRCTSSCNFFIRSLQMSVAFYKSSFFLNYSTHLYGGDRMQ